MIEFSLDKVSLRDPAVVDYFELEAELIEPGSEADLAQFMAALQANWPLPAQIQSKFEAAWAATPRLLRSTTKIKSRLQRVGFYYPKFELAAIGQGSGDNIIHFPAAFAFTSD